MATPPTDGDGSKDESANVGEVGDASALDVRYRAGIDELDEEPDANEERGGDHCDPDIDDDDEERFDAVAGVGDDESPHDGGDGSAGAESGDGGGGAAGELGEHSDRAAHEIEDDVAPAAHGVLHLRSECPEEDHVADDVHPAAMHEHGSEDRDPLMAGEEGGGDGGPLGDEVVPAEQLENEDEAVDEDDEEGRDRENARPPGSIGKRDDGAHGGFSSQMGGGVVDGKVRGLGFSGIVTGVRGPRATWRRP